MQRILCGYSGKKREDNKRVHQKPIAENASNASKPLKDVGQSASSAADSASKASKSFGTLAGEALRIVAVGGSLALAGAGF